MLAIVGRRSEESNNEANNGGEQDGTSPAPQVEYYLCNLSNDEYQARVDEMASREEMLPYIYGTWVMEYRLDWHDMLWHTSGRGFDFRDMEWMSPFRENALYTDGTRRYDRLFLGENERGRIEFRTDHSATVNIVFEPTIPLVWDVWPFFWDSARPIGEASGEFRFEFIKFRRDNRHYNMLVMNDIGKPFPTTEDSLSFQIWTPYEMNLVGPIHDTIHFAYTISNDKDDPTQRQVLSLTLAHTEEDESEFDTQVYVFRLQCD